MPDLPRSVHIAFACLGLAFLLALTGAARLSNWADVFIDGNVFFVDADCYSRMTRVREILSGRQALIRWHGFENHPEGVRPHTTAPMDYVIAALALGFRPLGSQAIDLAGAFVSPLLGIAGAAFLWAWSRRQLPALRWMLLLLYAISPILVHGTRLGRPDHQSLLIVLATIGLAAEWSLWEAPSRLWGLVSGGAWGLALWVSLYEPLIIVLLLLVLYGIFRRRELLCAKRIPGMLLFLALIAAFLTIEQPPLAVRSTLSSPYFEKWAANIGELRHVWPGTITLYGWVGLSLLAAPGLLIALWWRDDRHTALASGLLAFTLMLTVWQARWGYFFVVAYAIMLPVLMRMWPRRWIAWVVFIVSLWPVLSEWESQLFSTDSGRQRSENRLEQTSLRDVAIWIRSDAAQSRTPGAILAPWWQSPALVYWSEQPAVAGSSHESLPGIVDSARFFVSADSGQAREIAEERDVSWVVAYDADRVLENSYALLSREPKDASMAQTLWNHPKRAPAFLSLGYASQFFRVYKFAPVQTGLPSQP